MLLWLGKEEHRSKWCSDLPGGEVTTVAEIVFIFSYFYNKFSCVFCLLASDSVSDVIILMLVNGKWVAYQHIPSHLLMYSGESRTKSSPCGRVQTLQLNVRGNDTCCT